MAASIVHTLNQVALSSIKVLTALSISEKARQAAIPWIHLTEVPGKRAKWTISPSHSQPERTWVMDIKCFLPLIELKII